MTAQASIKMILVDDRSFTSDLDRAGYRKMGVSVKPVASYEDVERALRAEPVDVIVVNMDFRQVDAAQLCSHLKSQAEYKDLPIVVTSVQTSAKARNIALKAGADLFVVQPIPRQYFIEKLKQLLEQKTRGHERVDHEGDVSLKIGEKEHKCTVGDLSTTGILLTTQMEIEDGTLVELTFMVPAYKKPIKAYGVVVRTIKFSEKYPDRPCGIGIRFETFEGDSQKRLEKYVEKTSSESNRMIYYL